jgi:signal transduction histidine kinase
MKEIPGTGDCGTMNKKIQDSKRDSRGDAHERSRATDNGYVTNGNGDLLCVLDNSGAVIHMNKHFRNMADKAGVVISGFRCGHAYTQSPAMPVDCPLLSALNKGRTRCGFGELEIGGRHFEEVLHPLYDASGERHGALHFFRDITENSTLQKSTALLNKMTAVGTLAAEIAHEVNNPLDYITNYLYLLEEALPSDFADKHYIEKIQKGVDHLAQVMRDLVDYARPMKDPFEPLFPYQVLDTVLEILEKRIIEKRIVVNRQYTCREKPVPGSERMLRQVFTNVINNALDAMQPGGCLRIVTASREDRCVVEIEDTGTGISSVNLPKIFDPFFTTKKNTDKRGTGLGLSVSYNIVSMHDGTMGAVSTEGKGTLISITLPWGVDKSKKTFR